MTKKEPKKEALIQLEVYDKVSRRKKYISTDEYILKTQSSPVGTGGLSIIKHPNAAIIKARIDRVYNQVQDFIYSERCGAIDDVDNWNKQDVSASINIIDFIKADLKRRDVSYSVLQYNNSFIKRLEEYGQIRTFDDLSYDHIMGLDTCLRKTINSDATLF